MRIEKGVQVFLAVWVLAPVGCGTPGSQQDRHSVAVEEREAEPVVADAVTVAADPNELDLDGDGLVAAVDEDDHERAGLPPVDEDPPCEPGDSEGAMNGTCSPDGDGDGFRVTDDCDDESASVNRFAVELRCNGLDDNCDGHDDCDGDLDGVLDRVDLDPADPRVGLPIPDNRGE